MKNKHNKFVVFLDVDGVLNTKATAESSPSGSYGIDFARVAILAKAVKADKRNIADIVLTSDWKDLGANHKDYIYLIEKLGDYKLEVSGHTSGGKSDRGKGVLEYLKEHPEIKEYVILDDNKFDFLRYTELKERLLFTGDIETGVGKGIENASFLSETPAVEALIFMKDIKSSL